MEVSLVLLLAIFFLFQINDSPISTSALAPPCSPAGLSSANQFVNCLKTQIPINTNSISKLIFTPKDEAFTPTLQAYIQNSRFNRSTTPKPVAIVTATAYSHVQAVVVCSKMSGVELRIRSGGHDYEGLSYVSSYGPFAVLDMHNLRKVKLDVKREVAWVQAGAILGEVYYNVAKASNHTLAFPAGVCLTLGVGGHISGGGYGMLMRKHGLSIDNILDAEAVDAKGRVLNRKAMGEDLFWAIRGGGGASFAVVLSWKLRLVQVPQTVTVFSVPRTLEEGATDIIEQWQRMVHKVDPNLFMRAQPESIVTTKNKLTVTTIKVFFNAMYLGSAAELLALINSSFPLLGLKSGDCIEMPWAQSTLFGMGFPKGTPLEKMLERSSLPNYYHKHKSDYFKKPVPRTGWESVWKKMIELKLNMTIQFSPYGGRMSEIAEDATPYPHRADILFHMQYVTSWSNGSLEEDEKYVRATRELYDTFTPYVSKNPRESFLNYRDIDIGTNANGRLGFAYDYFKGNVERLLKVKAKVDPGNLFRYEQSIPVILT